MRLSNNLLAFLMVLLIIASSLSFFTPIFKRAPPSHISGLAPGENQTGIITADVMSLVSLNLTDNLVDFGNVSNEEILNTSYESDGAKKDTLIVMNVGTSPAEVDFWSHYALFYDRWNDTAKQCNGNESNTDCRLFAQRNESDPSFKFSTEGLTGTGCLIDAYELSLSGYKTVIVAGTAGIGAPQVADQIAGGDSLNISFMIDVPRYEESGIINTTVYISGNEDIDGKDANC